MIFNFIYEVDEFAIGKCNFSFVARKLISMFRHGKSIVTNRMSDDHNLCFVVIFILCPFDIFSD